MSPIPVTCPDLTDVQVAKDYAGLCSLVADRIAALVQTKPNAVLGLATGSTPLGVYSTLVRRHREEGLDFSRVTCFNLDEYYPMSPKSLHSYRQFMAMNLFDYINCENWSVPNGRKRSALEIDQDCLDYEARIADAGGIDLQLLGIGRTGHVGFNEPGSPRDSRTRLVTLADVTRKDAAPSFGGIDNVPRQAVSMGIGTIMDARELVMMATGAAKAAIVRAAWTEDPTDQIPATWVRSHPNIHLCLDESAAALLLG